MADRLTPEQLEACAIRLARGLADGEEGFECPSFEELITIMRQAARDARTLAQVQAVLQRPSMAHIIASSSGRPCPCWQCVLTALLRAEED